MIKFYKLKDCLKKARTILLFGMVLCAANKLLTMLVFSTNLVSLLPCIIDVIEGMIIASTVLIFTTPMCWSFHIYEVLIVFSNFVLDFYAELLIFFFENFLRLYYLRHYETSSSNLMIQRSLFQLWKV